MTTRSGSDQWVRELKASLMGRVVQRVMSARKTGVDGMAKWMVGRTTDAPEELDSDFEHPDEWNRPID